MSETEIGAVLAEIRPLLLHGWVQKIYQPSAEGIILEIRTPGQTLLLLLNAHPNMARLHLVSHRPPSPPQPPAFCQFLRARLRGARLTEMRQLPEERVVELSLQAKTGAYTLVASMAGRSANLFLLDADRHQLALLRGTLDAGQDRPAAPSLKPGGDQANRQRFLQDQPSAAEHPISCMIESWYQEFDQRSRLDWAERERTQALKHHLKKCSRRIDALEHDLQKAERYAGYARYGELLKANLGQIRKGDTEVSVIDYFDEALPTLLLPLDPAKSAHANMDEMFRKYRKYLNAQKEILPRLTATKEEQSRLRHELSEIEQGRWRPPQEAINAASTYGKATHVRDRARTPTRKGPFRRFQSADGHAIYVGRNARENDELTHRVAQSEDLWLHARGVPGSHVIVRVPKGQEVLPETLQDAATLALLYSDLKKSGKGEVMYTRKKWVRKPKGQAAGSVLVTQERSLFVTLDKIRLTRLKGQREDLN